MIYPQNVARAFISVDYDDRDPSGEGWEKYMLSRLVLIIMIILGILQIVGGFILIFYSLLTEQRMRVHAFLDLGLSFVGVGCIFIFSPWIGNCTRQQCTYLMFFGIFLFVLSLALVVLQTVGMISLGIIPIDVVGWFFLGVGMGFIAVAVICIDAHDTKNLFF